MLSAGTLSAIPHTSIGHLRESAPELYTKLWCISLLDSAINRYWVFRVGRLVGRARIANFFAEMFTRLHARGLWGRDGFQLPINQGELGDICGMTAVHTNRMIAELRAEGICTFRDAEVRDAEVRIADLPGLFAVGQFDWDYLFLPETLSAELAAMVSAG